LKLEQTLRIRASRYPLSSCQQFQWLQQTSRLSYTY